MSDITRQKADQLVQIGQNLKNKGASRHEQFREMDNFFGFQSNDEFQLKDGGKVNRQLYASEGRQAVIDFAAGMHGNLTNPTQRWFGIETNKEDAQIPERATWADIAEEKFYEVLAETNFMSQIHEAYIQLGKFNNLCIYSEFDQDKILRYRTRNMRDIYFSEASNGEIDRVYWYYTLTAKQMKEVWGDKAPDRVNSSITANNAEEEYNLIHVVQKRKKRNLDSLLPKDMPWASYHIFVDEPDIIEEGGYKEMPYHIARFYKEDGDVYGIGPSFYLLPSIRQIDFYKVKNAENYEIQLNPPILFPNDDYIIPDTVGPRTYIIGDDVSTGQGVRKLDIAGDIRIGELAIANEVEALKRGFFLDRFSSLQGITKEMTATETAQLINESTRYLGPVVGRLNTMLRRLLERSFRILLEVGKIPPPPEGMTEFNIRFESFLTRAQRATELADLDTWLARIGQMAQLDPSVLDIVNSDEVGRGTGEIHGIKQRYINSKKIVAKERQARKEAAAEQAEFDKLAALGGGSV